MTITVALIWMCNTYIDQTKYESINVGYVRIKHKSENVDITYLNIQSKFLYVY